MEDPDYPPIHGVKRLEVLLLLLYFLVNLIGHGLFFPHTQIYRGTGFVLEPYKGNRSRTLVNYLAHVSYTTYALILKMGTMLASDSA